MNIEERAKMQLFVLLREYINDGWSNARIREFFQDGINLNVDDPQAMKTHSLSFNCSILTEDFLADIRSTILEMGSKDA